MELTEKLENNTISEIEDPKLPKNCKENRYYYRHREEILERKKHKRLEDPEYQEKQKAKEDAKKAKEEAKLIKLKEKEEAIRSSESERKKQIEERGRERAKKKAELLGVLPAIPSGVKACS
jgi:flagellar biosynthesis/type III secretory pathway protein FliH